jgi:hypothetical protein
MTKEEILRSQLLDLLGKGNAHMAIDEAVADFPMEYINHYPLNVTYTPWHLLEHLRITQWDILEFMRNPQHTSPEWPVGYWPAPDETAAPEQWEDTIHRLKADLQAVRDMVQDPDLEILSELPHAPGYTYLREFLLVADHNAYHIGEFAILRQVMGTWPKERSKPLAADLNQFPPYL